MEPVRIGSSLPPLTDTESAAAPTAPPEVSRAASALPATGGEAKFLQAEVGDEVLVAFEHGDPRAPFVTGGLWNADAPPTDAPTPSNQGDSPCGERAKLLEHQLKNLK